MRFTLNHFNPCIDAISEATQIHDQMWPEVQLKTSSLQRIHIYPVLATKESIHANSRCLSSYFDSVENVQDTSVRELVSQSTD